jgi:3-oxoadipate enol-lactonase
MPHVDLNGVSLHYQLSGLADGPVVMFSCSLGTTMEMWKPQLAAFERDFKVLRYDMRGHGLSSTPAGPYTIAQLGNDVVALLDHLGVQRMNLCGLSIGGMIGQWLAANEPSRLERLVLCNTAAKIGTEATWNSRIEAVESGGIAGILDAVMERWLTAGFRASQPAVLAEMRAMLAATDPKGYVAACAAIRDMDQRGTAASIQTPTFVVAGEFDPVTTVADSEFLVSHIPGAAMTILPAAHISNVEASAQFNRAVFNFFAGGSND